MASHAHSQGPFGDPENPFQDPSITSALNSTQHDQTFHLDADSGHKDHQDFSGTSYQQYNEATDPFSSAYDQKTLVSPATEGLGTPRSTPDLQAKEEALRQRERELAERERALEARQQQQSSGRAINNFPPCFPFMYLNISVEIPLQHQWIVWWAYREWLLFEVTLVLNFIACLCVLFKHPASVQSAPTDLGVALTEMFTHTIASFFLWYRPVYNAYMKESSLYYFFFFIFNGFHILYTFYKLVGIPSTGGAGLILLVALFSDGYILPGILTLLATIGWFVMGLLAIYVYKKTYDHYKEAGHTFKEAKTDALVHMGKSDTVRQAAWNSTFNRS
ncbi:scamp family-domain-containing protein [Radiomyces spectabilis]|uniref:scamp family-domain-containing protein n=1 Tax=Radiomyces spectabilis TaxID=64574 RepID=UPI00221E6186|nr:scamp family-domain-containing protein [Radiomyces spectabilis]KAI8377657.1 scamp family-domain-containing protein [Radiomyces spectabilis]